MIRKRLLIHNAVAYEMTSFNADRKKTYGEGIELNFVRFQAVRVMADGAYGKQTSDNLTLYFDCELSEPKGFIPKPDMKVVFENREYFITSVTPCYSVNKEPCHYEVSLV